MCIKGSQRVLIEVKYIWRFILANNITIFYLADVYRTFSRHISLMSSQGVRHWCQPEDLGFEHRTQLWLKPPALSCTNATILHNMGKITIVKWKTFDTHEYTNTKWIIVMPAKAESKSRSRPLLHVTFWSLNYTAGTKRATIVWQRNCGYLPVNRR